MDWLVLIGRASIGSLIGAAVVFTASIAAVDPAEAAQSAAQPQLSLTCQFTNGPRTGQRQSYAGVPGIQPAPIGTYCADGQGSTGMVVADEPIEPPLPAPSGPPAQLPATPVAPATTFICRFDSGPRAGQTQSYAGVTGMQPIPVGAQCTDGEGDTGVAIAAPPVPPLAPVQAAPPAPRMSSTCQFDEGPRAGQIQSYAGVTGIQPMLLGSPCTDGQGSSGVAVPDPSVQAPAPVLERAIPAEPPPASSVQPPVPVQPTSNPPPRTEAAVRAADTHRAVIGDAAVGAPVHGLRGAVWADPDNSGYVTGYTLNGRYHRGRPAADRPTTRAVRAAAPVVPAPDVAASAALPVVTVVGRPVSGLAGAVWADFNNDGVADGYVYNGQYYPGMPPGPVAGAAAAVPPAPTIPSLERSGERG